MNNSTANSTVIILMLISCKLICFFTDFATVVGFLVVGRSFMDPNDLRRANMTHSEIMEVGVNFHLFFVLIISCQFTILFNFSCLFSEAHLCFSNQNAQGNTKRPYPLIHLSLLCFVSECL